MATTSIDLPETEEELAAMATHQTEDGRYYLDTGLVVLWDGKAVKRLGFWDVPIKESRQASEIELQEEDFELPDPDDDEAWERWDEESIKRIEKSGKRQVSELLRFARPYNYAKKLEEHQAEFRERMKGVAQSLREGAITHAKWHYQSQVNIARYTSDGYRIGKAQAEGKPPSKVRMLPEDRKAIAKNVKGQYDYFSEFSQKVKGQIEAGEQLTTAVDARANLYGGSVRSAMNDAYVGGQGGTMLRWVRHKEDSCPTCIGQEGKVKSGREWSSGGILPSQNVQCNGNCGCELVPEGNTTTNEFIVGHASHDQSTHGRGGTAITSPSAAAKGMKTQDVGKLRAIVAEGEASKIVNAPLDQLRTGFPARAERVAKAERDYWQAVDSRPSYAPGPTRSEKAMETVMEESRQNLRFYSGVLILKSGGKPIPPADRFATSSTSKARLKWYRSGFGTEAPD